MVEVFWVTLGSPRGAPELSWLSWALLGCFWLLLAAPGRPQPSQQRAPESNQNHDNQHGPTFSQDSDPQRIF